MIAQVRRRRSLHLPNLLAHQLSQHSVENRGSIHITLWLAAYSALQGINQPANAIPPVDFCMMAKAMGAKAHKIRHPKEFEQIDYHALCSSNGPTLLDVYIDPEEAPPLGMV